GKLRLRQRGRRGARRDRGSEGHERQCCCSHIIQLMSTVAETPIAHTDPVNAKILAVSEDRIQGFVRDPIGVIAAQSGVDEDTVLERVRAMLRAGTIRRVRQTLMATNLAEGALVAWQFPPEKLEAAFDFMVKDDPFSGHVVIRSTDAATPGSNYRLWTTLKVPQGYSLEKHCELVGRLTGAERFRVMPANRIFALGVGHVRRKGMEPGERVTRCNALFHWAVPHGREIEAGREVGRFHILTHCYWREGGPEFRNVNIMAVAHGTEKEAILAHKRAIDEHLASVGI